MQGRVCRAGTQVRVSSGPGIISSAYAGQGVQQLRVCTQGIQQMRACKSGYAADEGMQFRVHSRLGYVWLIILLSGGCSGQGNLLRAKWTVHCLKHWLSQAGKAT